MPFTLFVNFTESGSSPDTDTVEERLQGSPEVEEDSERRAESATSLSCSTVLREQRPSEIKDLILECDGSLDLSDDKCSDKCSESPLEDSPDLWNSISAVQVNRLSWFSICSYCDSQSLTLYY